MPWKGVDGCDYETPCKGTFVNCVCLQSMPFDMSLLWVPFAIVLFAAVLPSFMAFTLYFMWRRDRRRAPQATAALTDSLDAQSAALTDSLDAQNTALTESLDAQNTALTGPFHPPNQAFTGSVGSQSGGREFSV